MILKKKTNPIMKTTPQIKIIILCMFIATFHKVIAPSPGIFCFVFFYGYSPNNFVIHFISHNLHRVRITIYNFLVYKCSTFVSQDTLRDRKLRNIAESARKCTNFSLQCHIFPILARAVGVPVGQRSGG